MTLWSTLIFVLFTNQRFSDEKKKVSCCGCHYVSLFSNVATYELYAIYDNRGDGVIKSTAYCSKTHPFYTLFVAAKKRWSNAVLLFFCVDFGVCQPHRFVCPSPWVCATVLESDGNQVQATTAHRQRSVSALRFIIHLITTEEEEDLHIESEVHSEGAHPL